MAVELGMYSFGDLALADAAATPGERTRALVEEIVLADEVGLDVFGVGEHHRPDFVVSRPPVVLAAAAARTQRIRLSSAVTVLSSEDPVRAFQDFTTLDLVSGGRAELMAGRGSFVESFPLYGYELHDYDELFDEKLRLLLAIRDSERVTWRGRFRAPLADQPVLPRPDQGRLPVWVAVGGSPPSVVRAAELGLPMALAIIGGDPVRFAPLVDLYRRAFAQLHPGATVPPVSLNMHGFVTADPERGAEEFYPGYAAMMNQIARERGFAPLDRDRFDDEIGPHGPVIFGDPKTVAQRIIDLHGVFGFDRFLLQVAGAAHHGQVLESTALLGTEVAPLVRAATG